MSTTASAIGASLQERMQRMASTDRIWGTGFIVVLWVVYAFVFYQIVPIVQSGSVATVLTIGAALVLLFTTASVAAMLRQFADNIESTYEPDIRHLDEKRERALKA